MAPSARRNGARAEYASDSNFAAIASDPAFKAVAARLADNGRPLSRAKVVARLDPALLTEDVIYDSARKRFLVSSIHQRKIVAVDTGGRVVDFIRADRDDLWGFYGLVAQASAMTPAAVLATLGER